MIITHQHRFAADLDRVVAMLADETFLRHRAKAAGALNEDVLVDGSPAEGFTVSIRRTMPASSIPAEMRGFVGRDLTVRYTEVWEAPDREDRVGTFALEIVGAPGHVAGALGLTPDGDATDFLARGDVTVQVPFVGPIIERAVADAVATGLTAELSAADEWLAAR